MTIFETRHTTVHNYLNLCLFKFHHYSTNSEMNPICIRLKFILIRMCGVCKRGACLGSWGWPGNLAGAVFIIQAPLIGYFVAV